MKCELNMYAHVNLVGEVSKKKKLCFIIRHSTFPPFLLLIK